jgi:YggT family protein
MPASDRGGEVALGLRRRSPGSVFRFGDLFGNFWMNPLLWLLDTVVSLYIWMVVAQAVLSLLIGFGIVNARQPLVSSIGEFLYRVTEPVLAPIRRRMPNLGPVDISPMVLIIGLLFLMRLVHWVF